MLTRWSQFAALPLRLVPGVIFSVLGTQKLFGYFGGAGLAGTAQFIATTGLTPAMFWAWVAGLVELVGGAALLVGVLTRWTALILATDTIAALALYVAGAAVNLEVRLVALAALVSLALLGPQRFAADAALPRLRSWSGAATADATRKAA